MNNYQRIRDLREDADMTQKDVAEKLYHHIEIGTPVIVYS